MVGWERWRNAGLLASALWLWHFVLSGMPTVVAQEPAGVPQPRTRAEASDYQQTSSHADVLEFLDELQRRSAQIRVETLATSVAGRAVPLVVVASPEVGGPIAARREGRVVVYVQANIHGGEVEGKEVALRLLRDVTLGSRRALLTRLVLLVAPIYNADGNDAWGPASELRSEQQGPDPIGLRANGQGLDLNRDCMKAVSPEMRGALAAVFNAWDPDVVFDLHTTNGTRHHYSLTYAPPLTPNTDTDVMALVREELLPTVGARLRELRSLETFVYGDMDRVENPTRWVSFSPEPRYVTNYVGARNRIGILSEATSYRPFRERVAATWEFVDACLAFIYENAARIADTTRRADQRVCAWGLAPESAPPLGIRFAEFSRGREVVRWEGIPSGGAASPDPARVVETEVEVCDRFQATRTARLPRAYWVGTGQHEVVELLRRHGVRVERLLGDAQLVAERFRVAEIDVAERPFQGHRLTRLEGRWENGSLEVAAGSYLVRTAQPLALLAFHLLEPESLDGVAAWGLLDRFLAVDQLYPLAKIYDPISVPTRVVSSTPE
ncbi:MAG: M14 family metallopeptidase [Planctomycetota bacterium]